MNDVAPIPLERREARRQVQPGWPDVSRMQWRSNA
jgi:hypothetical protein